MRRSRPVAQPVGRDEVAERSETDREAGVGDACPIAKARGGKLETVPAVQEWKLLSEPIIFVVGRDGVIIAKFEGIMDYPELQTAIIEALK